MLRACPEVPHTQRTGLHSHLGELGSRAACHFGDAQLGQLHLQVFQLFKQLLLLLAAKVSSLNLGLKASTGVDQTPPNRAASPSSAATLPGPTNPGGRARASFPRRGRALGWVTDAPEGPPSPRSAARLSRYPHSADWKTEAPGARRAQLSKGRGRETGCGGMRPLRTAPYKPGWQMGPQCSPRASHPRTRAPQRADGTRFHRPHHFCTICRSRRRRKEAEGKRKGRG